MNLETIVLILLIINILIIGSQFMTKKSNKILPLTLGLEEEEKIPDILILPELMDNFPNPQAKVGLFELITKNFAKLIQDFASREQIDNERLRNTYDLLKDGLDQFIDLMIKEIKQYISFIKTKTTVNEIPFSKILERNELSHILNNISNMRLSLEVIKSLLKSDVLSKKLKDNILKKIDEKELSNYFSDLENFYFNYSEGSLLKGAKVTSETRENINEVINTFKVINNFIPLPIPPLTNL
jgi:hypothetical protein